MKIIRGAVGVDIAMKIFITKLTPIQITRKLNKMTIMNTYIVFQKYSDSGEEWSQESIPLSLDEAKIFIERLRKSYPDRYYTILHEIDDI